jgi:tRNA nucleotidyltransferase (CCA-adding enzyme)
MFKSSEVSRLAVEVCRTIQSNNKEAYLVGGAVRDMLMGTTPGDFDIATSASTDQVMRWFSKVIPTGLKHGTVTVLIGEHKFEVTTFRGESMYSNGRHPDFVYPVHSIEEDLSRRDFSVNAIAFDPLTEKFIDPFGGAADILLRRIKAVGDPMQRFAEDGLRCLRACRFAATLGFRIEYETSNAIWKNREVYEKVAVERVVAEWKKAFKADKPSIAFWHMFYNGLLDITMPELRASFMCQQNKYHAYDVLEHVMHVLDAAPKNELVQLAALFHDIAKPACKGVHPVTGQATFYNHEEKGADMTKEIMTRLKFSTDEIEKVSTLVRHHLLPHDRLSNAALRRWVRKVGAENVDELLDLAQADLDGKGPAEVQIPGNFVSEFRDRLKALGEVAPIVSKTSQLAINGKDVMVALDIGPGPDVGKVLAELLEYVTEFPERNTRELLLRFVDKDMIEDYDK